MSAPAAARPLVGVACSVFLRSATRPRLVSLRRVALIRRGAPPALGLLSLPGGRLELGETMAACAAREAREETGLRVDVEGEMGFCATDAISKGFHYAVVHVLASVAALPGGAAPRLRAGDDAAEALWVARGQPLGAADADAASFDELEARGELVERTRAVLAAADAAWRARGYETTMDPLR